MTLRETLAEALALLRSMDNNLKVIASRRKKGEEQTDRYARGGDRGSPKPCATCPMQEHCQSGCAVFDQWRFTTGLDRAKPGMPKKWVSEPVSIGDVMKLNRPLGGG